MTDLPDRGSSLAKLVESASTQMVVRGTNVAPVNQLLELAEQAYEKGAAERLASVIKDPTRIAVCAMIARELLGVFNCSPMTPQHFEAYRLLGDVYSAGKQHPAGLQRDVHERAESLLESFKESLDGTEDGLQRALRFLRELFVNALLEARETAHHVDWGNPDQVELYTIAVEAESKRYEEINLKIAEAEKAERPYPEVVFSDVALQAIPNWFDEMSPGPASPHKEEHYLAGRDPLFTAALNRAFAIGVQSAQTAKPEGS